MLASLIGHYGSRLTKEQAFKPHQAWRIPAEVLIQTYRVATET